ncbi:homospermidine synthase [Amaricoccus macauensis]|uniref:Homospermidine synthase n=1 Tax=Amaricoccus macauensis TaxID=57001 RepID=A0A840STW3_9RHOB|nr:saccharopine dehydrogenase NADP-binding domain-containing protein [Amaricoccus macauensis]MBB5223955.1 homospermidine synthase [Amaricoccus macauensis]
MPQSYPNYGRIDGPVVLIGFGSIGQGTLPLIERHFTYDPHDVHVIEPSDTHRTFLEQRGVHFIHHAVTRENYRALLGQLFKDGKGFCVNLSVDTSSIEIMQFCREIGVLYIDTVVEPWAGHYFDLSMPPAERTNYALREARLAETRANPGGTTAVSCCGANPGMVSWLLKEALLRLAKDTGHDATPPKDREGWAKLMQSLGVKGVHIAERDTQAGRDAKPLHTFVNTWSVEGFVSESFQPAELGWGTHERWFPPNGHRHDEGCRAAIYLDTPGMLTKVHTWTPEGGPQYGFLVTHNEAISIADYFTVGDPAAPEFRPTCHYAYHPCGQAVLSLHEMLGSGVVQETLKILDENEILWGEDCLGVLIYGHERNALWYGSRLSIQEARALAPFQNATGLQVTSAVLAGMAWALRNPNAGIVETEEMDHAFCLDVMRRYLGRIEAHYTDWTPIATRWAQFAEEIDEDDPWQFQNVLAT